MASYNAREFAVPPSERLRKIPIDVAAAADANHKHEQYVVLYLVDDTIIADADSVKRVYTR